MSNAVTISGKWRIKPSGKLPIFLRFMINSCFDHKIANKVGFKHHIVNRVYLNHMMYWPAKEYDAFEKEIIDNAKNKKEWVKKYCRRELKKSEFLYQLGLKLKKINWAKKSNQEIEKTLTNLLQKYRELGCAWYAQYPLDEYFEEVLGEYLAQKISISDPDFRKIVLIFTDPQEMTDVAEERWKLMKMVKKFRKQKEKIKKLSDNAKQNINKHLNKFSYINRGLATSKPYTFDDIIGRIEEAWNEKNKLEKSIYHSSPEKIINDYKWALNKIKPATKFKKIITHARLHSYTRNRRVEALFMADYGASFIYHEVARRNNFNPDWIMEVSVPEMFTALKGKQLPNQKEMQKRFRNYAMVVKDAKTKLIVEEQEIKKLEQKYYVVTDKKEEIKGNVACLGGIIRGKAKICLDKSDISKIKKGDILVAQFTTPDFVPAMEKAAAIVADQGGLSSHAAIVSRELNVPCVIATKNGTRVIHDNDLLEVDARNGIVKILKRAK
ncbi:hypothetical protein KKH38_02745 [Patescibacteria group bacterium]|nr:hypothetical protein [Patescibacteria group bacterium]MBU4600955.1 hypothetical protein [Patescibacteria group bacterium]